MRGKKQNILVAAGGTGGHIVPALAIAEEWRRRRPEDQIIFIGTHRGIEKQMVPPAGFRLETVIMSGWARGWGLREIVSHLLFPFRLLIGLFQSLWILMRYRPALVIGCGGYVTGPVVWLAAMMNRLTFVQEQNSRPGRTSIILSSWVCRTFLAYEQAKSYLHHPERTVICGNPIRKIPSALSKQEARQSLGLDPEKFTLLIVGGSQGARAINQAVRQVVFPLTGELPFQLLWQTGQTDYADIRAQFGGFPSVFMFSFIDRMHEAYSSADVILCRAGAMTLSEIACYGLPAILVPYPYAADNHQETNAMAYVQAGAAVMINNVELQDKLLGVLRDLYSDASRRKAMSESIRQLATPDAAETIVTTMIQCMEQCRI